MERIRFPMPTHFALRIIVATAICAVCIVAPLIISSVWPTPYIVRVGQEVPGDIDVHAYAIEPTVSAGSSFYFVLESAMGRNAELMIACSRPFSCMVDGKTAYVYEPQDAYMRLHRIPVVLSSTHAVTVALHANDTGHDAIKAAIAETSVMDRLLSETDSFYCFAYGIYGVVIVGCLTLLIRKSSERAYLLPLVLYVLVMFATSLFTLNSMPSTILYEDYSPFRVYVTLIGETAGILVVIFTPLSGNERGRSKKSGHGA